jgi:hypothetical protein
MPTETALPATRDMTLTMVNASSLPPTTPTHLTSDVEHGTGTTKYAFNALTDGFSTPRKSVLLFPTFANQTMFQEPALPAMKVTILKTVNASSPPLTTPTHLTSDVEHGIGKTRSAWLAPTDGSSMLRNSVYPLMTTATSMLLMDHAPVATKATL